MKPRIVFELKFEMHSNPLNRAESKQLGIGIWSPERQGLKI